MHPFSHTLSYALDCECGCEAVCCCREECFVFVAVAVAVAVCLSLVFVLALDPEARDGEWIVVGRGLVCVDCFRGLVGIVLVLDLHIPALFEAPNADTIGMSMLTGAGANTT